MVVGQGLFEALEQVLEGHDAVVEVLLAAEGADEALVFAAGLDADEVEVFVGVLGEGADQVGQLDDFALTHYINTIRIYLTYIRWRTQIYKLHRALINLD